MIYLIKNLYKKQLLILYCLVLLTPITLAQNFDPTAGTGWSWYIDPLKKTLSPPNTPATKPSNNTETRMQQLKQTIQHSLNRAILDPNQDNIAQYIHLQNMIADHSHHFASTWQQTLLQQPELDYSLIQPTNTLGRQYLADQAQLEQQAAIDTVADSTGLLFFFRGDCPVCHRFAPVLKQFAVRYDISVIAISLDGEILPDFPQPKFNDSQAQTLNIPVVPAVFAANPYTKTIVPIAFGLVSEDVLLQRLIEQLIPTEQRLVKQTLQS